MLQPMFPLIFCSLCAQKFWCVRTVLEMTYICKLGEDQKNKAFTQNWNGFWAQN